MTSRDAVLKTEILNSSDKRMSNGEKPGPIKSTAEIRRGQRKKRSQKTIKEDEKKDRK